ncbi:MULTISPECIES: hypothetical protein [unclassified Bacteroides]|uniref:hypothetical protein n=1 Tax=unclassified Bacteroides TaxID=2646097 RepID=UPI001F14B860|nr:MULTISPECIES: hypothetical protein [unclassified Bacteroides]
MIILILLRPKLLSQCLAVKSVLRKISLGGLLRISVDAFDKGQAYKDRMEVSKKNVDVFMVYKGSSSLIVWFVQISCNADPYGIIFRKFFTGIFNDCRDWLSLSLQNIDFAVYL